MGQYGIHFTEFWTCFGTFQISLFRRSRWLLLTAPPTGEGLHRQKQVQSGFRDSGICRRRGAAGGRAQADSPAGVRFHQPSRNPSARCTHFPATPFLACRAKRTGRDTPTSERHLVSEVAVSKTLVRKCSHNGRPPVRTGQRSRSGQTGAARRSVLYRSLPEANGSSRSQDVAAALNSPCQIWRLQICRFPPST